jgi:uncharacterized membrane protein YGL010W
MFAQLWTLNPSLILDFPLLEQLALYTMFHRDRRSVIIHGLMMPVVVFGGLVAFALVPHAAVALTLIVAALYLLLDVRVAGLFALWIAPMVWLAELTVARGLGFALLVIALTQTVGWLLISEVGHVRCEPKIQTPSGPVDSNLYMRRGHLALANLGRKTGLISRLEQIAISPFALTLDAMYAFGFAPDLRAQVHRLAELNLERLAHGKPIFAAPL